MTISLDSLESYLNPANWDSQSSQEGSLFASRNEDPFQKSKISTLDSRSASENICSFYDRLSSSSSSRSGSKDWSYQLEELKFSFSALQREQLFDALTESSFSDKFPNRTDCYTDLAKATDEELRVKKYIAMNNIGPSLSKAAAFLSIPCVKSQEVALAIIHGKNPFVFDSPIGEGGNGVVKKCTCFDQSYAAKSLKHENKKLFVKEYEVPIALDHPNIVKVFLINNEERTIFFELAQKGSLKKCLSPTSDTIFTRKELLHVLQGISSGLAHMHLNGYIHGDVKPDNILITDTKDAKITDFGTCEKIEEFDSHGQTQGTVFYLSPEYLTEKSTKDNCNKIDVWGFGMILWHILKQDNFMTPFVGAATSGNDRRAEGAFRNPMSFVSYIADTFKGFPPGFLETQLASAKLQLYDPTRALTQLMNSCLSFNPNERPTMQEIATILAQISLLP